MHATSYSIILMAIVMFAICHQFRYIRNGNMHDRDLGLQIGPRPSVNMTIERPCKTHNCSDSNVYSIGHRLRDMHGRIGLDLDLAIRKG